MNSVSACLLAALRATEVHLPAGELAAQVSAPLAEVRLRLGELRTAGFEIEERPGLGLRLLAAPDRLIADDLSARLGRCALVRELVVFKETSSTNQLLLQRGRQGAAAGLTIFAEKQTAGRGRFGRRWESAAERGLWFSVLLRPKLPLAQWPRLTTWAAVAVAAALEEQAGVTAAIKWPNDVFLGGRKVAGILIESELDGRGQHFAVLGIGVNVNHEAGDFPPELDGLATSLRLATGRPQDRSALACALLRQLAAWEASLAHDFAAVVAEAGRRSFLLGRWVKLHTGREVVEGWAEQLNEDGHLILRCGDGSRAVLTAGEVTVLDSRADARSEGARLE